MSYFYNNKVYDYYQLNEQSYGEKTLDKGFDNSGNPIPPIEIINNEKITFDFTGLVVHAATAGILNFDNVETIKIHIDWGDGTNDRLSKPLISDKSSIGVYRPNQWKVTEHVFNVTKRYEYKTNDTKFLHKIIVTAYNSFNDKFTIIIPYKMVYKTLYDLGSEFTMFSSNTTNTNKVSYTLKQKSNDSMIVVMSKDWKSIYGEDDIEIIEEQVSDVFADDFTDEDLSTWDWKSVPTINLTVQPNESLGKIFGNFYETGISIDEWESYVIFPKDTGDLKIKTSKIEKEEEEEDQETKIVYEFETDGSELERGIYAVSINPIIGINGVKGSSDVKYIQYNTNNRPRNLTGVEGKDLIQIDDTTNKKEIVINYTFDDTTQQVKNLTKVELQMVAEFVDVDCRDQVIDDIRFSYDLKEALFDKKGKPLYLKNQDENKNFSYAVKMRNIPSTAPYKKSDGTFEEQPIHYNVQIVTNDVIGGADLEWIPTDNNPLQFSYDIGSFDLESVKIEEQNQIDKTLKYKWKFTTFDEWDEFKIKWVHIDSKNVETVMKTDIYKFSTNGDFNGLDVIFDDEGNITEFSKDFDGNILPDGRYKIINEYNVHMDDYYETRTTKHILGELKIDENGEYVEDIRNFYYKRPQITIDDIRPHTLINYDPLRDKYSLSFVVDICSDYNDEPLKNISLQVGDGDSFAVNSLNQTYTFNTGDLIGDTIIEGQPLVKKFTLRAQNENDIFNRDGNVTETITINSNLSSLLSLPMDGSDFFDSDVSKLYNIVGTEEYVDWLWVKQNTLHDVNKEVSFNDGKYFGGSDCGSFIVGSGSTPNSYAVYETLSITDGITTHARFRPYLGSTSSLSSPTILRAVNDIVKASATCKFQKISDKGTIIFNFSNKTNDIDIFSDTSKIKNMFLELYSGNKFITSYNIKGLQDYTIENLKFGKYEYKVVMNSEYTRTSSNNSNDDAPRSIIDVVVPLKDTVTFNGKPNITSSSDGNTKYINWAWEVNHTSAEEIYFKYIVNPSTTNAKYQFNYVKAQNVYQSIGLKEGDVVEYYFLVKSKNTDGTDADKWEEDNSFYVVNRNTYTIPTTSAS